MFSHNKLVFIVSLNFNEYLATKCMSLNDEPCMTRPTPIDLNPIKLKYYRSMISLDKCYGSCDVLFPKICVPKKQKTSMFKYFILKQKNKNEAKTMIKRIPCDCKCKFSSTACNSIQKWNNKIGQCECKNYHKCKKRL